jgi:WD40 repeat protein
MTKLIKVIAEHAGSIYAVTSLPKKKLILTGGADKIVASWNMDTFENTPFSIKTNSAILNLNYLEEKNELLIGLFNGNFHVIDIESRKEIKFIPFHKAGLFSSFIDKEKKQLVLGSGDGTYSIWNYLNYSLLDKGKLSHGKIRTIEKVKNEYVFGTSEGALVGIDDEEFKPRIIRILDQKNGINSILYLPSKEALLCGTKDAHITAYHIDSEKEIFSFPAHNWPIYQLKKIDEHRFVSCSRDKTIKIWNNSTLDLIERLDWKSHKSHTHSVNNLHLIPNSHKMISVGDGKRIVIWELD